MWIAFSGAHRTGKTTLIGSLPGCKVGNVMRELHAEGIPVGLESTPATMLAYVKAQAIAEQTHLACPLVMSDRALVDGYAYVSAAVRLGIATYPWTQGELQVLRSGAMLQSARYAFHVLIPAEFDFKPEGSFHDGGSKYQAAIEEELTAALIDWPCPVVTVHGTPEDRASQILALLDEAATGYASHQAAL